MKFNLWLQGMCMMSTNRTLPRCVGICVRVELDSKSYLGSSSDVTVASRRSLMVSLFSIEGIFVEECCSMWQLSSSHGRSETRLCGPLTLNVRRCR